MGMVEPQEMLENTFNYQFKQVLNDRETFEEIDTKTIEELDQKYEHIEGE